MTASLRELLRGILDYAGLFPPAALDMTRAAGEYARLREADPVGLLARFVVPADRLPELARATQGFAIPPERPWELVVLASPVADPAQTLPRLGEDLASLAAFLEERRGCFRAPVLELRYSPPLLETVAEIEAAAFLEKLREMIGNSLSAPPAVFLEIGFGQNWDASIPRLMPAVGSAASKAFPLRVGVKIRSGGPEAASFPTPTQVATFLLAARDAGLPLKATAGLHHPVRRFAPEVNTRMHGFLNVFGAAVLAHALGLESDTVVRILEEEDPRRFRFSDEGFAWEDLFVPTDAIRTARAGFAVAFGSCSYQEPREDLEALGLL